MKSVLCTQQGEAVSAHVFEFHDFLISCCKKYEELANSGKFERLDVALTAAITGIAKGELGRTLTRTVDTDATKGVVTKERQLLWLICEYNKTNEDANNGRPTTLTWQKSTTKIKPRSHRQKHQETKRDTKTTKEHNR